MKLSLVVLTPGKTQGVAIPITLSQFVIGRDPQCNLRPASALISKRHCVIIQRKNQVFLRDFDSTNGSFVNDQPVQNEVELHTGDTLKVGPLEFRVQIEATGSLPVNQLTPPPPTKKAEESSDDESAAALLLSLHDEGGSEPSKPTIPEGSTEMEILAVDPTTQPTDANAPKDKKDSAKSSVGNTSAAAKAILDKYTRRPRAGS
jgi:predicted component of type VI protein secretion system